MRRTGLTIAVAALAIELCVAGQVAKGATASTDVNASQETEEVARANSQQTNDSLVVFFRPKRFTGGGLTPSVYVDGQQIARLDNGRYFSLHVTSGKHQISSSMKHSPLDLQLKPGETVYLEMVILAGNWRGGGRFIPASAEDALKGIKKLKPLDSKWIVDKHVGFDLEGPQQVQATKAANDPVHGPTTSLPSANTRPETLSVLPTAPQASLEISSTPEGADIELDGSRDSNPR
ncbi:MAG: DUF2846 domain-containing protein [Terriglobales bacterium]